MLGGISEVGSTSAAQGLDQDWQRANGWVQQGQALLEQKDFHQAVQRLTEAKNLLKRLKSSTAHPLQEIDTLRARCYLGRGDAYCGLGQYPQARYSYQKAQKFNLQAAQEKLTQLDALHSPLANTSAFSLFSSFSSRSKLTHSRSSSASSSLVLVTTQSLVTPRPNSPTTVNTGPGPTPAQPASSSVPPSTAVVVQSPVFSALTPNTVLQTSSARKFEQDVLESIDHVESLVEALAANNLTPGQQTKLLGLAQEVLEAFAQRKTKTPDILREVVSLAAINDLDLYRSLIDRLLKALPRDDGLLDLDVLVALKQAVHIRREAGLGLGLSAGNASRLLSHLLQLLEGTSQQRNREELLRQLELLCVVLDVMVESGIQGIDRKELQEPLLKTLRALRDFEEQLGNHKWSDSPLQAAGQVSRDRQDVLLPFYATYALQALAHIPNDEGMAERLSRQGLALGKGVLALASAVTTLRPDQLVESLAQFGEAFSEAGKIFDQFKEWQELIKGVSKDLTQAHGALPELDLNLQRRWYINLLLSEQLLREGRWPEFEAWSTCCSRSPQFLQGLIFQLLRLGRQAQQLLDSKPQPEALVNTTGASALLPTLISVPLLPPAETGNPSGSVTASSTQHGSTQLASGSKDFPRALLQACMDRLAQIAQAESGWRPWFQGQSVQALAILALRELNPEHPAARVTSTGLGQAGKVFGLGDLATQIADSSFSAEAPLWRQAPGATLLKQVQEQRQIKNTQLAQTGFNQQLFTLIPSNQQRTEAGLMGIYQTVSETRVEFGQRLQQLEAHQPQNFAPQLEPLADLGNNVEVLKTRYLQNLEEVDEIQEALKLYVDPEGISAKNKQADLMQQVKAFLRSDKKVLLLLGVAGSGKSTFNRFLAKTLWEQRQQDSALPIPAFIALSSLKDPHEGVIERYLKKEGFEDDQIKALKNKGAQKGQPFIFILDGFDEIENRSNAFYEKNELGQWNAKIILSSRPEYLGPNYLWQFSHQHTLDGQRKILEEIRLATLSEASIQAYVERHVKAQADRRQKFLRRESTLTMSSLNRTPWTVQQYSTAFKEHPELRDLIGNPFLLRIAVAVLPGLGAQQLDRGAGLRIALYQRFIQEWFERSSIRLHDIQLTSKEQEVLADLNEEGGLHEHGMQFSQNLAVAMYAAGPGTLMAQYDSIKKRSIPEGCKTLLGNDDERIRLLRFNSPLIRQGQQYRFIHKSIRDYLAALKMAQEANEFGPDAELPQHISQLRVTRDPAILDFLLECLDSEDFPYLEQGLLNLIECSKTDLHAATAAANAITVLVAAQIPLAGKDFNDIRIPDADLTGANLEGAQLKGADLTHCTLRAANLSTANLDSAQFAGVDFDLGPHKRFDDWIISVRYTDKWLLVATRREILLLRADDLSQHHQFKTDLDGICCLELSADGKNFAVGNGAGAIEVWDLQQDKRLWGAMDHGDLIGGLAFSPDGRWLASASKDRTVRVWGVQTGNDRWKKPISHKALVYRIAFSPDGCWLVSGSANQTIEFWSSKDGTFKQSLEVPTEIIYDLAFSPDGHWLASGSDDGAVRVWKVESSDAQVLINSFASLPVKERAPHHTFQMGEAVTRVAFSPDSKTLVGASGNIPSGGIEFWDLETETRVRTLKGHEGYISTLGFSADGQWLASGSRDQTVRLWSGAKRGIRLEKLGQTKPGNLSELNLEGAFFGGVQNLSIQNRTLLAQKGAWGISEAPELFQLIKDGSPDAFQAAWVHRSKEEPIDTAGNPPLHIAAAYGNLAVIQHLLHAHPQCVSQRNPKGQSALHLAARFNQAQVAQLLLDTNAKLLNEQDQQKRDPLMLAAFHGALGVFDVLLKRGADLTLKDDSGYTAFKLAVLQRQFQVLLSWLAVTKDLAQHPLHIAVQGGHLDVVKILLDHDRELLDSRDRNHKTALMLSYRNFDIAQHLLEARANPYLVDNYGDNALHIAVRGGNLDVVKILLDHDRELLNSRGGDHKTALMLSSGNFNIAQHLLEAGADPELTDNNGRDILHYAVMHRAESILRLLFEKNSAMLNRQDARRMTVLMYAAKEVDVGMVWFLLRAGADPNFRNDWGRTARDYVENERVWGRAEWDKRRRKDMDTIARSLKAAEYRLASEVV